MLSAKFFDDLFYNNAFYAKLGGVSTIEMNSLELEFLQLVNFTLFVTPDVYNKYHSELRNYAGVIDIPNALPCFWKNQVTDSTLFSFSQNQNSPKSVVVLVPSPMNSEREFEVSSRYPNGTSFHQSQSSNDECITNKPYIPSNSKSSPSSIAITASLSGSERISERGVQVLEFPAVSRDMVRQSFGTSFISGPFNFCPNRNQSISTSPFQPLADTCTIADFVSDRASGIIEESQYYRHMLQEERRMEMENFHHSSGGIDGSGTGGVLLIDFEDQQLVSTDKDGIIKQQ